MSPKCTFLQMCYAAPAEVHMPQRKNRMVFFSSGLIGFVFLGKVVGWKLNITKLGEKARGKNCSSVFSCREPPLTVLLSFYRCTDLPFGSIL